jgi:HSP20 family protein
MKTANYIPVGVELGRSLVEDPFFHKIFNLNTPLWASPSPSGTGCCSPAVSIAETADNISVSLEAPGFKQEDFTVLYEEGTLKISGQRQDPTLPEGGKWVLRERPCGSFSRAFALSCEVQSDKITATYRNGVLEVALPKSPRAQAHRVEVK